MFLALQHMPPLKLNRKVIPPGTCEPKFSAKSILSTYIPRQGKEENMNLGQ